MWIKVIVWLLLYYLLSLLVETPLASLSIQVREQSLKMLQTGVEEFKIFLWKISHPNIKLYFGFIPQQKNEKKVNTPTTKKKV